MRLLCSHPGGRAPRPGRCTCQVRGRRSQKRGCQTQLERNQSQHSHTWELGAADSTDLREPRRPGAGRESRPSWRPGPEPGESQIGGRRNGRTGSGREVGSGGRHLEKRDREARRWTDRERERQEEQAGILKEEAWGPDWLSRAETGQGGAGTELRGGLIWEAEATPGSAGGSGSQQQHTPNRLHPTTTCQRS